MDWSNRDPPRGRVHGDGGGQDSLGVCSASAWAVSDIGDSVALVRGCELVRPPCRRSGWTGRAPFTPPKGRGRLGQVHGLDAYYREASRLNGGGDRAQRCPERFDATLPPLDPGIQRQAMLGKQELATGL